MTQKIKICCTGSEEGAAVSVQRAGWMRKSWRLFLRWSGGFSHVFVGQPGSGFTCPQHFSRMFKNRAGLSPGKYRRVE